jgi:nitric oxide reductase activation protein
VTERRNGHLSSARVYSQRILRAAPRSLLILIDASQSSADELAEGLSSLDCARMAALLLIEAAERSGDRIAVYAFCSDGRAALQITPVKLFAHKFDENCFYRLAKLHSAYSTRLGAALRYAHQLLVDTLPAGQLLESKELLVFTDAEASDIDSGDPAYLREDARRAVMELRAENIDISAIAFVKDLQWSGANNKNQVGEVLHPIRDVFGKSGKSFSFR